ncbi:MAG: LuxR C-terminal-related transcriptional regulator [Candidatus Nanopelagicales bacterium]
MITVAQRSMYPVPMARSRFAALTISDHPEHLSDVDGALRSLGATAIAQADSGDCPLPRPASTADICILDASHGDPCAQVARLRAKGWRRIVVVAPTADSDVVRRTLAGGARSYIVGKGLNSPVGLPTPRQPRTARVKPEQLSQREIQVLELVAEGMSNRGIGERLCLSALTVKSHLARISRKLGAGDRAEIVAMAFRSGLMH